MPLPVAHHCDRCPGQERDVIQLPFGADLLDCADQSIHESQTDAGERVSPATQSDEGGTNGEQEVVEEGEEVGAQNREHSSRSRRPGGVGLAGPYPLLHLRGAQPHRVGHGGKSSAGHVPRAEARQQADMTFGVPANRSAPQQYDPSLDCGAAGGPHPPHKVASVVPTPGQITPRRTLC